MRKCRAVIILLLCALLFSMAAAPAGQEPSNQSPVEHFEKQLQGGVLIVGFRLMPGLTRIECAYSNPPKTVEDFALENDAILTVNGGYWDADYKPTDFLVVDGRVIKAPNLKNSHYGLFYVKGGNGFVRDLRERPFCPKERFEHAIKCGPTLVMPGGRANPIPSQSRHARIVVGKDKTGKLFFAMTRLGRMTYHEMTEAILAEPFHADYAFNLDGGPSVGYYFRPPGGGQPLQERSQRVNSAIRIFGNNVTK